MTPSDHPQLFVGTIRADNPGPMTLEGTNTWIVSAPDTDSAVLIDPGPELSSHAANVDTYLADRELAVEVILLTHGHLDHSESAAEFGRRHDAPVRAVDQKWSTGQVLRHGETVRAAGVDLEVLATPGHTSDSVTFVAPGAMFTGDTVLGRGTSVVAHPDGRLGDYLDSLEAMHGLAQSGSFVVYPGHGPVRGDAAPVLREYLDHRHERLNQVRSVIESRFPELLLDPALTADSHASDWLAEVVSTVVDEVYAQVPENVKAAAAHSVRAQVLYLAEMGG